jgi:hypothetical protein
MRIERRLKYALPHVAICVEKTSTQKGEHDLSELGAFLKFLASCDKIVLKTSGSAVNICRNFEFFILLEIIGTRLTRG